MNEAKNKYVLAMYDVRGKQNYIYKSRHIKEIMGGSAVIEDLFEDYLFPAANTYRETTINGSNICSEEAIYSYSRKSNKVEKFSSTEFEDRMKKNCYLGEVVYEGGGNFFILYKNAEICRQINRIFTKKVLEETRTLMVLCTYVEIDGFDNYKNDRNRIYDEHRKLENINTPFIPSEVLPITQTDSVSSLPLCDTYEIIKTKKTEKLSAESICKYKKYDDLKREDSRKSDETFLDNLITKKGEESLLAIIYADGNSMGDRVQKRLEGMESYDDCVTELRRFSMEINNTFVKEGIQRVDELLKEKHPGGKNRRAVIAAGDEITIICNARDAYDVAMSYLKGLPPGYESCAGIAIFHSHTPFADVYRIAEECCESGKSKMKAEKINNAQFLDFHFCQSGIGTELEDIRKRETGDIISKPWFVTKDELQVPENTITTDHIADFVDELSKISRTNLKGLLQCAKISSSQLRMELDRIRAHSGEIIDVTIKGRFNEEEYRKIIYDIVSVYDLWFDEQK